MSTYDHLKRISNIKVNDVVVWNETKSTFNYACTKQNYWDKSNYKINFNLLNIVNKYFVKEKGIELHLTCLADKYDKFNNKKSRIKLR